MCIGPGEQIVSFDWVTAERYLETAARNDRQTWMDKSSL
jgi:hypothetical protein